MYAEDHNSCLARISRAPANVPLRATTRRHQDTLPTGRKTTDVSVERLGCAIPQIDLLRDWTLQCAGVFDCVTNTRAVHGRSISSPMSAFPLASIYPCCSSFEVTSTRNGRRGVPHPSPSRSVNRQDKPVFCSVPNQTLEYKSQHQDQTKHACAVDHSALLKFLEVVTRQVSHYGRVSQRSPDPKT
jgi:hypothetical protein